MGSRSFIIFVLAILSIFTIIEAGRCPPPNKVPRKLPPCRDDYDCNKFGQVCCRDQANAKSCAYPAPYASGHDDIYKNHGQRIYPLTRHGRDNDRYKNNGRNHDRYKNNGRIGDRYKNSFRRNTIMSIKRNPFMLV